MFICTRLIDSSPPATATGTPCSLMPYAARAIACRPDEQKRLTVWPAAVMGKPARMAHWRAMLPPGGPSGVAQPPGSSPTAPGAAGAWAGDVAAGGAFGIGAAHRYVLDVAGIDAGALDGLGDHMPAHVGAMCEVEGSTHGFADWGAGS